jgi:methylmalonyl-CoA mutase
MAEQQRYAAKHPIRIVTAAALFDGHDASINVMRRLLQQAGCEVIHLGHNRSSLEVVSAALQEDAQAIALSSYQGGHVEYFRYVRQLLDERGARHVRIFGGGGGVIVPDEIRMLEGEGTVERIYSPEDGRKLGLLGMIDDLVSRCDFDPMEVAPTTLAALRSRDRNALARWITRAEAALEGRGALPDDVRQALDAVTARPPVVGITGTGGAGKSSLTDELLRRFLLDDPTRTVAVLSVDPTRKRTGGALLGDRIRMNALDPDRVFMRSLATRHQKGELSAALADGVRLCALAGFDLVLLETSGIGQGDVGVTEHCDVSLYVMTPEFGAASQLEKIDMLDYADLVAINKFEKRGGEDAFRDVRKQVRRNRNTFDVADDALPVFGTVASRFADEGVTALYHALLARLRAKTGADFVTALPLPGAPVADGPRARPRRSRAVPRRHRRHRAPPPRDRRGAGPGRPARGRAPRGARGGPRDPRRRGVVPPRRRGRAGGRARRARGRRRLAREAGVVRR